MLRKIWGHLSNVLQHKWIVFCLCCKAGIPFRGIIHDLSKFSPTEFLQGVKYYGDGRKSPIEYAKQSYGYSKAWLHHKGRNKHHPEYWYDETAPEPFPIIPFKYICEMVCDQLAAGKVYQGKDWTKEYQLAYWKRHVEVFRLNDKLKKFITQILEQVAKDGIDKTITKKNLKECYNRCVKENNLNILTI